MHPRDRIQFRSDALKAAGQWREPSAAEPAHRGAAFVDARSNDYLGFAWQPVPPETSAPSGAGASRLISGTHAEHRELERALSAWLGFEECLVFSSGYAANVGAISALAGPGETILSDALNHASIIDGCRLSRAEVVVLPHRDVGALERALAGGRGVRWVVTESCFGMDGDAPDLAALRRLCDVHGAALIVDEAHALGVFGPEGRGVSAEQGVTPDVLIGGMGKALGIHGGFVASASLYRDWLWNRARSLVFSTAPSPAFCTLAVDRVAQVRRAEGARARLRDLELRLVDQLCRAGVDTPPGRRGPVFPVVLGTEAAAMAGAARARELGVLCHPVRPPTVPRNSSRLRVTLRADMSEADVSRIGKALAAAWQERVVDAAPRAHTLGDQASPVEGEPISLAVPSPEAPSRVLGEPPTRARWMPSPPSVTATTSTGNTGGAGASNLATDGLLKRWLILGTGTGVGKTFVARGLLRALAEARQPAVGLKPIETGVIPGQATDAAELDALAFRVKPPECHPFYAFREPVTPARAARAEGVEIDLRQIVSWANTVAAGAHPSTQIVIETAGGVFSPLSDHLTNFELGAALGADIWILVAPNRLGVLHDVSSALHAMTAFGRRPDWIILSAPETADPSTASNREELGRLPSMPPVLELARNDAGPLGALLRATTRRLPASHD